MSDERKRELQQEIQQLAQQALKFREAKFGVQGELEQKSQELIEPVLKKVNEAIALVARQEDFDMVFDTRNANIVFVKDETWDLTDRVIEEMQKLSQ